MRDLVWKGKIKAPGTSGMNVRVEINTGEALRFSPYSDKAFDSRGVPIERTMIEYPGIDELYAYYVLRTTVPKPMQAFVLCARTEGNTYAFYLLFNSFDGSFIAQSPDAGHYTTVLDVFLGRQKEHVRETPIFAAMEEFFAREDCIEDRRDYVLSELTGTRKGKRRKLFSYDPFCGWTAPWERITLPLKAGQSVTLEFRISQNRKRIFVDRAEIFEAVPAPGVPVIVELPTYRDTKKCIETVTNEQGLAIIRIPRLGNRLRKRFVIGVPDDPHARQISGYLLLRPPEQKPVHNLGSSPLPGFSSRARPDGLNELVVADILACFDPDLDSFADPLTNEPVLPDFRRASYLVSALPPKALSGRIERFVKRARKRHRRLESHDNGYDRVAHGLVKGIKAAELVDAIEKILHVWAKTPLKIWTEDDARNVLELLTVLPARRPKRLKDAAKELVSRFCRRLHRELEPTFYVINTKRPIKTFCASPDPVAPHALAVLALSMAEQRFPGLVPKDLQAEQANHVCERHGFYDCIPDMVAYGRKGIVEFTPLLSGARAFKLLSVLYPDKSAWFDKFIGYRDEIFEQYKDHYERLTLLQRFELLSFTARGIPPYFDEQGKARGRSGGNRRGP